MERVIPDYNTRDPLLIIDNYESATKVAGLLIEKLQELQVYMSDGRTSCHLLKQLKYIIFSIYYSAEKEYTALLHDIVSYVLLQMFKYEN